MIPRFLLLSKSCSGPFVTDLDTEPLERVFHSSGDASSSGMTGGRRQRCRGTWIVRRAIACRDEGRAPDLVPTRRAGVIWTSYVLSGRSCRLAFQLRRHPRDRAGRRHLSGQKSSPLSQDVVVEIQLRHKMMCLIGVIWEYGRHRCR